MRVGLKFCIVMYIVQKLRTVLKLDCKWSDAEEILVNIVQAHTVYV